VLEEADLVISVSKENQKELLSKIIPKKYFNLYWNDTKKFKSEFNMKKLIITVGKIKRSNFNRKGIKYLLKVLNTYLILNLKL